jgi:hypothetical protein
LLSQSPNPSSAFANISRFEKFLIALLPIIVFVFGGLTLQRAAFLKRPQTDIGVYLRAAWAVTAGEDISHATDDNGWSYTYPQILAILAAPLADAPIDPLTNQPDTRGWHFVPYEVSVVVWYALSIIALWYTAKWLGQAIRLSSPDPRVRDMPVFCRRWWQDMLWPSLVCMIAIGSTLVRGQTNTLLSMCVAGMILWTLRGRSFGAGGWIALAACVKVFPAFLGYYALLRRDWKMVAGSIIMTIILLVIIPAVAIGPQKMWSNNIHYLNLIVFENAREFSGANNDGNSESKSDRRKIHELQTTGDNQSLQTIFHAALRSTESGVANDFRPGKPAKVLHAVVGIALIVFASVAWWRMNRAKNSPDPEVRGFSGYETMLTVGLLASLMLAISPMCHLHYFVLAMPLVAALLAIWKDRSPTGTLSIGAWAFIIIYFVLNLIPRFGDLGIDALRVMRHLGAAQYANLMLFAAGIFTAFTITRPRQISAHSK